MTPSGSRGPHTVLEALVDSLGAAVRSADGVEAAAAILWTDADGQWEQLIPRLREVLPQLFTRGPYAPADRTGPAIWLRCVVDGALPELSSFGEKVPIFYLPRVSRQALRSANDCPEEYQPLVELQYRGGVWHQVNGRDWSVEAFLTSDKGLGLEIARDAPTRAAMLRALPLMADIEVDGLRGRRLEADDFDKLAVPDAVRDLLRWMHNEDAFTRSLPSGGWDSFRSRVLTDFGFDIERQTPVDAADKLVRFDPRFDPVWQRFSESPLLYPRLPALLQQSGGEQAELAFDPSRSPTANANAEESLRAALDEIAQLPHRDACDRILTLETQHALRRERVWTQLGLSPYAGVLAPLARLAARARTALGGSTSVDIAREYADDGWKCDQAAMQAIASARSQQKETVSAVVRALYLPWLDVSARHFQAAVAAEGGLPVERSVDAKRDACIVFVDGLRFDVGATLAEELTARGCTTRVAARFSTIPTVTATAKPASTPIADKVAGHTLTEDFTPQIIGSEEPATAVKLREKMAELGAEVLTNRDSPAPSAEKGGWTECGELDAFGHAFGARVAEELDREVERVADRVQSLLEAGWREVHVVTDHGWLLVPNGLPKVDLPHYLTATKWGRCAIVRPGTLADLPALPWRWNAAVRIATPPGAGAFIAGSEYSHGGVSVQECVIPDIVVTRGSPVSKATIADVKWNRQRCRIRIQGASASSALRVDIRTNWKDASQSIAASPKSVDDDLAVSLVVPDEALEGAAAQVVLLDVSGTVIDKRTTTVGESA